MKKTTIILTFLAVILTSGISAQNAVMNVRTRNTVSAGQTFQITFDVNAHAQDFRTPSLKGLKLVGGPNTGFSSSTSIINGKVSQSVSTVMKFSVSTLLITVLIPPK